MSFEVMLRQLGAGFGQTFFNIYFNISIFTAAWNGCIFRQGKQIKTG